MGPAGLRANVGLMCGAVSPAVLLGPLCRPKKRRHLSPLHFLHGEHKNTANQYRESQSGKAAGASVSARARLNLSTAARNQQRQAALCSDNRLHSHGTRRQVTNGHNICQPAFEFISPPFPPVLTYFEAPKYPESIPIRLRCSL